MTRIAALAVAVTLAGAVGGSALDLSIGGTFGGNLGTVNSDGRADINAADEDIANMVRLGLDLGVTARALFGGTFGVQSGAMYYWRTGGLRDSDGPFPEDADDDEEQFSDNFIALDRMHILRIPVLAVARFSVHDEVWLAPHAGAMVDFLIAWESASGFADDTDDLDGEYSTVDADWRQPALSWAVGFDIEYAQEDERWIGAIGPRYSRSLTSFGPDDDNSDTDLRFGAFGINISALYQL